MQPSNVAMVVQLGWLAYSSVQQPQAEPASTSSLRVSGGCSLNGAGRRHLSACRRQ